MVNFLIVLTGYNCEDYVDKCLKSCQAIDYDNYKVVVVNDGSYDNTLEEIYKFDYYVINNEVNMGAAYGRYVAINKYAKPNDVVVLLGLDDEFLPDCLKVIAEQYEKGKLMTYGNWVNQYGNGLPESFSLDFDEETHHYRNYRKVLYRSTGPNTFYAKLFFEIPEEDFKLNGKWIDSTTESELMFSCLEMCGKDRIGIIYKHICIYNQDLPNGTLKRLGKEYKYAIYNEVIKRPKKPLYEGS